MRLSLSLARGVLVLALASVGGLASGSSSNSRNTGSFENPAARDRPRFRYWLPDASVDPQTLKSDIKAAGSSGAGGVELVPFYNYGGELGGPPPGVDWSRYGFGTPPYIEILRAALEAHEESGLAMDFAFGPSEGQGVPAFPDNEGLQWELVTHTSPVSRDGHFDDILPDWGWGSLVAAVAAYVVSSVNVTMTAPGQAGPTQVVYEDMVLRNRTLEDLSDKVSPSTGRLVARFPRPCGAGRFRIFAFYERRTEVKNLKFNNLNNATATIWDHGSYTVDHFSARGAKVITDFWDEHILSDPKIKAKLRLVGNYGWEDSLELKSTQSWSPTLPARFQARFGYDMRRYLPLFVFGNNNINLQKDKPGILRARLDTDSAGFVNDYRTALADGYIEYLETLRAWLRDTLDAELSVQPSYNMPMDMLSIVPHVDAPESESLQGQNNVDGYRTFSGPANLAGKTIISNELGAVFNRAYSITIPELLHMAHRCFSGGVNQVVIHGQSYSGDYANTTWPGHVPFRYYASDLWNTKRPDWEHGLGQALEYLGRIQHVQRQGLARVDVAVYHKKSITDPDFNTIYQAEDLISNGWSFNYLTAENLELEQAVVENGILAPSGPSYVALVLPSSSNLTLAALELLEQYAQGGLPIIVSGSTQGYYPEGTSADEAAVLARLDALMEIDNVYAVPDGEVSDLLYSLGLAPRVGVRTNGLCYTTWREDPTTGNDYAYVFSDTAASSGELVVSSVKRPFLLDPWTGTRTELLHYRVEGGRTIIPLTLAGNQSAIFAFSDSDGALPGPWFSSLPAGTLRAGRGSDSLFVDLPASTSGVAVLSSGEEVRLDSTAPAPAAWNLSGWTLIAEHWEAPEDMSRASVIAEKRNTTVELDGLVSWLEIPSLVNASGIGYYTTVFEWTAPIDARIGAYIRFPPALNAVSVHVNGRQVGPLDYAAPVADISEHLVAGRNEITAVVPSTMWNYIRTKMDVIENGGLPPIVGMFAPLPPPTHNGLVGVVSIIPVERVYVS